MVTVTSTNNILKDVYLDVIVNQLNTATNPFFNKVAMGSEDVVGKNIVSGIKIGINGGIGAGGEQSELPVASGNTYCTLKADLKNIYGNIELSDKVIRASRSSAGALVNVLNAEMEGLLEAAKFNFGRMLFQKGNGVLATVGEVVSDTNLTIIPVSDTRNFMEGMLVDFTDDSSVKSGGHKIVYVDRADSAITVTPSVKAAADLEEDDLVTLQGSLNGEIFGLPYLFDDDELQFYGNVRASLNNILPYGNNINAPITSDAIQNQLDTLEERSGGDINLIICSYDVRRKYLKHMQTSRMNIDYFNIDGGFKALSYNGIPIVADRFCPDGEMYFVNTDDFKLQQLCDWKWLEGEGGSVLRQMDNKPCYQATLVKYANLICTRPAGQGLITGIVAAI
ncbi:MAG: phage major capsid protein [Christensenellales bacterium]|jgi:hypothetical protein